MRDAEGDPIRVRQQGSRTYVYVKYDGGDFYFCLYPWQAVKFIKKIRKAIKENK